MTNPEAKPLPRIRLGGLLRCCYETWETAHKAETLPEDPGSTLDCKWCKNGGVFVAKDGVWEAR